MPTDRADRNPRVGVYIDFDNVVISRYDQVHSATRDAWRADRVRDLGGRGEVDGPLAARLEAARVDVGALLDYAASFGRVSFARAYADWSVPANAAYRHQLVDRAVDLTQLFPVSRTKNGADIRLAVDAVTDLTDDVGITHVVLVAGDSDYIALAQRCKKLGRYVIGIGVTGSTSRALVAACDEFSSYDDLPGVLPPASPAPAVVPAAASPDVDPDVEAALAAAPRQRSRTKKALPAVDGSAETASAPGEAAPASSRTATAANKTAATKKTAAKTTVTKKTAAKKTATKTAATKTAATKTAVAKTAATKKAVAPPEPPPAAEPTVKKATAPRRATRAATTTSSAPEAAADPEARRQGEASDLLVRALRVARDRAETPDEWLHGGGVKSQMQRMDGSFKEKSLGYKTFSAFVESRGEVVESRTDAGDGHLRLRLRP